MQAARSQCKACLQGVHTELIEMMPYPLYHHTFSRALPYVNRNQSVGIYLDLRAAGYIDQQGFGQLPQATNQTEWCAVGLSLVLLFLECTPCLVYSATLHSRCSCRYWAVPAIAAEHDRPFTYAK